MNVKMYEKNNTSRKSSDEPGWPAPLGDSAYHGIVGDIVRTIEPHTESDPAGILVQLLVSYGNMVGHGAHYLHESTRHTANLFAVLVGASSKARKGTGLDRVKHLLRIIDSVWAGTRILSGLSSGEGLIAEVRDLTEKEIEEDKPAPDKRLLVVESEFTSPLKMMARAGNVLSPVIRNSWDSGDLGTMTRKPSLRATGAHISIIGHITVGELRRTLSETEMGNGFANRFLWIAVRRSKLLPDGGQLTEYQNSQLARSLQPAVEHGTRMGRLKRNEQAKQYWHAIYPILSEAKLGLSGAVANRGEAQVLRLSVIYALLDRAREISLDHLLAAEEVWRYAQDSASYIFGHALGDATADQIYELLDRNLPKALSRTQISNLLGRNVPAAEIDRALKVLEENGRIDSQQKTDTGGRPAEYWKAMQPC